MVDAGALAAAVARLHDRIRAAGRDPAGVTVVAVTKGFGADAALAALRCGLRDLGENYVQELVAKARAVDVAREPALPAPTWHFIGRLQTNKVKQAAPIVGCWQSLDRASAIDEVARRAPGAAVFVQVNVSGEPQKGGCPPDDAAALVARARAAGLVVRGLMTVAADVPAEQARPGFRLLASLARACAVTELSMGMSNDLDVALEEGATMVRVGTALFGPRPRRPLARQ